MSSLFSHLLLMLAMHSGKNVHAAIFFIMVNYKRIFRNRNNIVSATYVPLINHQIDFKVAP